MTALPAQPWTYKDTHPRGQLRRAEACSHTSFHMDKSGGKLPVKSISTSADSALYVTYTHTQTHTQIPTNHESWSPASLIPLKFRKLAPVLSLWRVNSWTHTVLMTLQHLQVSMFPLECVGEGERVALIQNDRWTSSDGCLGGYLQTYKLFQVNRCKFMFCSCALLCSPCQHIQPLLCTVIPLRALFTPFLDQNQDLPCFLLLLSHDVPTLLSLFLW